ncbi:hypothetical protein LCGC14_0086550 [marine sediment metagenome]|uniref:Uncharacterized protein n=1 Tax=marine sediment metagenome TaxID=412755 RepID=A0A0F9XXZ6_9ZZZZ|nr:hypothetical protein [Halomonas sp.]
MMINILLKKVAVAALSFGLLASPLAFANLSIKANQDLTVNDEPIQAQSQRSSDQAVFSPDELKYDEGDFPKVIEAESTRTSDHISYQPKDLQRDNIFRNVR